MMRRAGVSAVLLLLVLILPGSAGASRADGAKIDPQLEAALAVAAPDAQMTVIVTLAEQADLFLPPGLHRAARQQAAIQRLRDHAERAQAPVLAWLAQRQAEGSVSGVVPFWLQNGISVTATPDVIRQLAQRPEVGSITPDALDIVPAAAVTYGPPEANLSVIHAPALWDANVRGQGVVVAELDSGVDATHPDLSARWRGGANSWYDPYGQHPTTPYDRTGHGTWSMGVMVGGDAGGSSIGIAPDAKWIAAKIFNDSGSATATAIHLALQWVLDPDKNPATADGADVLNNSWAYGAVGCNLAFQQDLRSLRAAGILPVFAAGNYGPGASTSVSPANYPEAFAVGATDNADAIYSGSSRGPSACGETATVYPEVVAPGVSIRTTDLFGNYYAPTGTSLSAPHAAGTLALLLSAYPDLTADQQAAALLNTAVDLGPAGPDNIFGAGRIDAQAAYLWLQVGGSATPTALPPTATPTALPPTPTPTALPPTPTPTALPPTATPTTPTPTPTATAIPTATSTPVATTTPTPLATATLAPTATRTSLPTATPTGTTTIHVGDLDRSATTGGTGWTAKVTIEVHNGSHGLVSGALVTGSWTGATGATSCTTDATGRCSVSTATIARRTASVSFGVASAAQTGFAYQSTANHDPDGDSNGTTITVSRP